MKAIFLAALLAQQPLTLHLVNDTWNDVNVGVATNCRIIPFGPMKWEWRSYHHTVIHFTEKTACLDDPAKFFDLVVGDPAKDRYCIFRYQAGILQVASDHRKICYVYGDYMEWDGSK